MEKLGFMQQLKTLVSVHIPYIQVITHEETRFLEEFYNEYKDKKDVHIWTWSSYSGLVEIGKQQTADQKKLLNPINLLNYIETFDKSDREQMKNNNLRYTIKNIFCLMDFNQQIAGPIPRVMRDMYEIYKEHNKSIIVVSPQLCHGPNNAKPGLEPTLERYIKVLDYTLPSKEILSNIVNELIDSYKSFIEDNPKIKEKFSIGYTEKEIGEFVRALQGLTANEAGETISQSIKLYKKIDIDFLLSEKKQILRKSDILEYIENKPSMEDVGGLDELKKYINCYSDQFSAEAQEFGMVPLKGILLIGPPGCAKSLICKAISSLWKLPLLRLDIGKVMQGIVGRSESMMRSVVEISESVAPCVLWIDEVEKAIGGVKSSNGSDSGTLSRVFGTLLTAMEEGLKDVVLVASANDISQLPPELIRRFNEVFFTDLPSNKEREEILDIHLRKRNRVLSNKDKKVIVAATENFTGAEIEKVVKEAIARSWRDGKRKLKVEDLSGAIADTKPLYVVMHESIKNMRDWAKGRARYASSEVIENKQKTTSIKNSSNKVVFNIEEEDIDNVN